MKRDRLQAATTIPLSLFALLLFPAWVDAAEVAPHLGIHHHAISTRSPLAQHYFDQGMVLSYGFNHPEALRSFQAAAIDSIVLGQARQNQPQLSS